jgi:hypothetical protein
MSKQEAVNEINLLKQKMLNDNLTQIEYNRCLVALIALYESALNPKVEE